MVERKPLIVIDGVAGAGKTTVTASLARALGLDQLYCSNIFRTLAHAHMHHGDIARTRAEAAAFEPGIMFTRLTSPALRSEEVGMLAGQLATDPEIHHTSLLLTRQAYDDLPATSRGLIAEGRGLGNEMFAEEPYKAGLKIFMTADLPTRAQRLQPVAGPLLHKKLMQTIGARDQSDMNRQFFRLAVAPDAVLVDTTSLSARQVHGQLRSLTLQRYPGLK